MMNKKGMSAGFIIGVVITLVAFFVIGGALAGFMSKASDKEAELLCQNSVGLRSAAALSIGSITEVKGVPLLCKTIDKKISGTKEEVKKELADLMTRCWWMFNAGRTENLLDSLSGLGGKNKGFLCYTVIVEEIKDGGVIEDFDDYLRDTKYPQDLKNTYLQYFQYAGGGAGRVTLILDREGIKSKHAYEIAFIEKKGDDDYISDLAVGVGSAVFITGAIVLTLPTGGTSLVALGGILGGGALVVKGAEIKFDRLMQEGDVSTIMLLDMKNKEIVEEFQKNVYTGDLAGD